MGNNHVSNKGKYPKSKYLSILNTWVFTFYVGCLKVKPFYFWRYPYLVRYLPGLYCKN